MTGSTRRLYISATRKSSGKTCIAIGLLRALWKQCDIRTQPFKKGPDYIDPDWLGLAAERLCFNLDFNTQNPEEIRQLSDRILDGDSLALIEGTKGLFDGVSEDGSDSNAALAKLIQAPVVLVLDCEGMTRGIAPLVQGYQQFDSELQWAGAILNRTGGSRHEAKLVQALEQHTDLPVLGVVGNSSEMQLPERHLGLITASEYEEADTLIEAMGRCIADGVDLGRVLEQADGPEASTRVCPETPAPDIRIGYARDSAFGFYYADDVEQFQQLGTELIPLETMRDRKLPEVDGLWIGGGFPETHAAQLAANTHLKDALRERINAGLPTYAECGGLMYLSRSLTWQSETHEMVGIIPGDCVMDERPQGRGLAQLEATADFPWPGVPAGTVSPAHEFHYSRMENLDPNLKWGWNVRRGVGIVDGKDGLVLGNLFASYTHLRHTQRFEWVRWFVQFVREHARQ